MNFFIHFTEGEHSQLIFGIFNNATIPAEVMQYRIQVINDE
jgi:hypothetical protein